MTRVIVERYSKKTNEELQRLLEYERQRPRHTVGESSPEWSVNNCFGGYVAKTTSTISAASDGGGTRTAGSGTCDLYYRGASNAITAITGRTGLTVYNSTLQTAASGVYIQVKVDIVNDLWWDVADCPT